MEKIKVGVIGCGKIAQMRHLPEYAANDSCEIVGVYDLNPQRTKEVAEKYQCKAYGSAQELLADETISAVSVCTANYAHAQDVVAALNAGKDVLCEKPMATNLEECEAMVQAAKQNKKFLMIGHNQRLTKAHMFARNLIEKGVIGKVLTFRTTFGHGGPESWSIDSGNKTWFFDKKRAVMGAMADLGVHKTDLIQYLTGQTVTEVSAFSGTLDKRGPEGELIGVDDNAICIYRLSEGTVGTMTVSWTYYSDEDNSTVLYGTEGVMRIYADPQYSIIVESKKGERQCYELEQIQTNDNQSSSGVIDIWLDCLANNRAPEISGEQATSAMRAVFAAIQSAREGRTIKL